VRRRQNRKDDTGRGISDERSGSSKSKKQVGGEDKMGDRIPQET
jgi:hypothetical protein